MSRSYAYGYSANSEDRFATGRDRTYRFCLPDMQVAVLARTLTGEGRSQVSGTATCTKLGVEMGNGKLIARQSCSGLTMPTPEPFRTVFPSAGTPIDVCGWGRSPYRQIQATGKLTVQGRYSAERLQLDFMDERQPLCVDPAFASRPYGRKRTIKGSRISDCDIPAPAEPAKP